MNNLETNSLDKARSTYGIIKSVLFTRPQGEAAEFRSVSRSNKTTELLAPLNVEEDVLYGFIRTINERRIPERTFDYTQPYWLDGVPYSSLDIFQGTIQYFDDHSEKLPLTSIPPAEDVQKFANKVLQSEGRVTATQQFEFLLDITDDNVLAAANLGWMATRLYARGADRRVYPSIHLTTDDINSWNAHIAQFEVYSDDQLNHGPIDNYYFWTHFFVTLSSQLHDNFSSKAFDAIYEKGTPIMAAARKYLANAPVTTPHVEASIIGRNIGLSVAELLKNENAYM